MSYVLRLLIDLDLSVGYTIWRQRGVTISGQTGRALKRPGTPRWARWLGAFLDWIQPGHCEQARLDDIAAMQASIAYLQDLT
jgi:hypothetical protein